MEAEVRAILENVVKPESRVRVGKALATMSRNIGLTNEDFEGLAQHHDVVPAEPPGLE
jgi:plasmid stability protein